MTGHNPERSRLELFAGDHLPEPFGLLVPILVVAVDAAVLQIAVRFVLAAVQCHEADRSVTEHIVDVFLPGRKIVLKVEGKVSPRLVVAAGVVHRFLRCEEFDGLVHESAENSLLAAELGDHVAHEENHIRLVKIALAQKILEFPGVAVDVIDHCERDAGGILIQSSQPERFL